MELKYQIEELISENADDFEIAQSIKEHIKEYLLSLEKIFLQNQGKDFLVKHTKHIDNFLILIYKYILRKFFGDYAPFRNQVPIVLVGMGSYGREELCVYSDIDLMIVYKDIEGYNLKPIIEAILYLAWDAGLKLGHRVHEVDDIFGTCNTDLTIKTAVLESRFLCGSSFLWMETSNVIQKIATTNTKDFVHQVLDAYTDRRAKNPMSMEPDIKNCVGGLRDTNTIVWLSRAILNTLSTKELINNYISEAEYKEYRVALEFLYRVRSALHLSAKKKQDTLNMEFIPDIAKKLGFVDKRLKNAQMALCTKTFSAMKTIDITCQIFINKITATYFFDPKNIASLRANRLEQGLYVHKDCVVASRFKEPDSLQNIIKQITRLENKDFDFDISYIDYIRKSSFTRRNPPSIYKEFKKIFFNDYTYKIIRTLYKANLLGQLIKPFANTHHQAQFDGYHKYPVDKHSILGLHHLEHIEDNFIQGLYDDLCGEGKALIKLCILLHDVGKGRRGNHSEIGAKIFRAYANKLGFSDDAVHAGNTLIKYHTLMNNIASREDLYSEEVILTFITQIQTPQILRLLYILTYCDINAVGPNIYNGFTANLLKELYTLSLEMFDKKELMGETKRRLRKEAALKRYEPFALLPKILQRKILSISSNYFFFKHKAAEIIKIANIASEADAYSFKIANTTHLTINIIRSKELNIGYLLGKLNFLELKNMDIFELFDHKKYFRIDYAQKLEADVIPQVEELIRYSFDMSKKTTLCKPLIKKGEIEIDCDHSKSFIKMTLNAKNQKGMMAYMMNAFDEQGIAVSSAKIQTIKNRARNLFLIQKRVDLCENKEKILSFFT